MLGEVHAMAKYEEWSWAELIKLFSEQSPKKEPMGDPGISEYNAQQANRLTLCGKGDIIDILNYL